MSAWWYWQVRNRVYTCIVSLRPANLICYQSRSPAELLKSSGLTHVGLLVLHLIVTVYLQFDQSFLFCFCFVSCVILVLILEVISWISPPPLQQTCKYCVPQLCRHIWAVLTGVIGPAGLGLIYGFVCFSYLGPVCFWCFFSWLFWVVSTSASDCLERLVSEVTYCVSSGM